MNNKKTVLILTSHFRPNVGGVETHLSDLTLALTKRRWKTIVATYKPLARNFSTRMYEKKGNLIIYRMPWVGFNIVHMLTRHPFLEFLYLSPGLFIVSVFALIMNPGISVIHAQGLVPAVVALVLGKITGRKVIVSTHNLYFFPKTGFYTRFSKLILSHVDTVLALSDQSAEEIRSIGVPEIKIKPFRYWLDLKLFKPVRKEDVKRKLKIKDKFICFFVGRLIETKGVLVLLKSALNLKNITFIFAGIGPLSDDLEKAALKHKNIKYIGPIMPDVVRNYMCASDLVCVPSLVEEGYGRVAMEAIATGTTVLAANKGGLSEVVNDKVGKLITPTARDYEKWLNYYYKNQRELKKLSVNARKYALNKFSERNVNEIIKYY